MDLTNPIIYTAPFFAVMIGLEIYLSLKHDKGLYKWKDFFASASMGLGALILGPLAKLISIGLFFFVYEIAEPLRVSYLGIENLGWTWYLWIICFFADDFTFYWHHRFSHTVRVLWAAHIVHHSSDNYNLGTGIRNGWFTLFYKPLWWLWLPLIGFHPIMILTCMAINSVYQFCLHSKSIPRLGFLEYILNTPQVHQVHHSCNLEYLDKNHGGVFIIWDKLFGTYKNIDDAIEPKFGVIHPPESYNPFIIVSHEYSNIWKDVKKVKSWKDKLKYIFWPPGWSHDNSTMTVRQIHAELARARAENTIPVIPVLEQEPQEEEQVA